MQYDQMIRISRILEMLKPIAVPHEAQRVVVPEPFTDKHNVVTMAGIDYVEHRQ